MVVGPALHGFEHNALVSERAIRVVADGVAQIVGISGGVGEVVLAVVFVHPGRFEETFVVVAFQEKFAVFVQNFHLFHFFGEALQVGAEFGYPRQDGGLVAFTQCPFGIVLVVVPALELTAPNAAKVEVKTAVVVLENSRINAVSSFDGLWFGFEGAFWFFAGGYPNAEHILFVLDRKVEVIHSIFEGGIGCPKLAARPGNVFDVERNPVVGHFTPHFFHG